MTRKPKYVKRQYNKSGYHGRRGVEHYPQKYIGHAEQKDNIGRKAYCIAKPNTLKLLSKYRSCEYCFFFFFFFFFVVVSYECIFLPARRSAPFGGTSSKMDLFTFFLSKEAISRNRNPIMFIGTVTALIW